MFTKWFIFLNKTVLVLKEKISKFFAEAPSLLDPKMLFGTVAIALFLPLLVVLYSVLLFNQERVLNEKMLIMEKKVKSLVELKSQQEGFVREFGLSSFTFLEKNIETIQLLREDVEFLSRIGRESSYEPIQKRIDFLLGRENQMHFISGGSKKSNYYVETDWKLENPVEASTKDLVEIISLVEGVKMDEFLPNLLRPQLIIKKISLKLKGDEQNRVFFLDLDILQRNLHAKN